MVTIDWVTELRPKVASEYNPNLFVPRTEAIQKAYQWGKSIHAGHTRLSGEPYFETHCVWVAGFMDQLVQNETYTIASLLHDSVEDRGCSLDDIRGFFPGQLGEDVAHIVDGVTKLGSPREGQSREIETLQKLAVTRDPGIFLVKLADKTHNMLTLQYMPEEKRQKKAMEAIRVYGKLAGILNCYEWRRWLEDIAFPFAEPDAFTFVKTRIDADPRLDLQFINDTLGTLGMIMEKCGLDGHVNIIVNGYWQSWQKLGRMALSRKASMDSFASINDIISFRMTVNSPEVESCYLLLAEVNRYLGSSLDQNHFDDYLASPQNGYRALQVNAWLNNLGAVEVAITTTEMEGENLWGVVYDMQHQKDYSTYHPLVIFTPTGGIRFVPDGSTVLDAVASIQNEFLLDKISAVEVNGNLARLSDKVNAGDVVEVITGKQRMIPNLAWLSFSNPSTTRLLRAVLANEAIKKHAEIGRVEVKTILRKRGLLALEDVMALENDKMDMLFEEIGCTSLEDLYAAVGGGTIRKLDLEHALDKLQINKETFCWTTIHLVGSSQDNHPGTLVYLLGLISHYQGNILRTVSNTLVGGDFSIHLVIVNLDSNTEKFLLNDFRQCIIQINNLEMV